MKGRSIFCLMISLAILCTSSLTVFAKSPFPKQQTQTGRSQNVDRQLKSQLRTWREFVKKGVGPGKRNYIQFDYDLPSEFRNGFVYFNSGASVINAYIIKQGLSSSSYPPVKVNELLEIDDELGDKYVKSGKAIMLRWGLSHGYTQRYGKDTKVRFYQQGGGGCLRITCLEAPFMTKEQITRILRSERRIVRIQV